MGIRSDITLRPKRRLLRSQIFSPQAALNKSFYQFQLIEFQLLNAYTKIFFDYSKYCVDCPSILLLRVTVRFFYLSEYHATWISSWTLQLISGFKYLQYVNHFITAIIDRWRDYFVNDKNRYQVHENSFKKENASINHSYSFSHCYFTLVLRVLRFYNLNCLF